MQNPSGTKCRRKTIRIPDYTLGEELVNSISHGAGALFGIAALVLMLLKARGALQVVTVSLFGASIILVYAVSCIYHALSRRTGGKKVLRVIDHCNVFLLVFGTYIPASLLAVGGRTGWILFGMVAVFTILGIALTAVDLERFSAAGVICHLISGWSILIGLPAMTRTIGKAGVACFLLGGVLYTVGAVLYALGARRRYRHSIFHFFCLLGTFFHFLGIYCFLL